MIRRTTQKRDSSPMMLPFVVLGSLALAMVVSTCAHKSVTILNDPTFTKESLQHGGLALLGTVGLDPRDQHNIDLQLRLDSIMFAELRKGMPDVRVLTVDSTYRALGASLSRQLRYLLDGNSRIDGASRKELVAVKNRLPEYLLVANALYDLTNVVWLDQDRTQGKGVRYIQMRIDVYSLKSDERVWSQRIEHRMARKSTLASHKRNLEKQSPGSQKGVRAGSWKPVPPSYLDMVGQIFGIAGDDLANKE